MLALAAAQSVVPSAVEPAAPPLPRYTAQAAPGDPVRILPLGASITYGYEYGSYRAPLWDLLAADGYAIDFVGSLSAGPDSLPDRDHEGHRGWRIAQIEERAAGWVQEHDPDIVLLHIGTNDLIGGASAQESASSMGTLLDTLTAAKAEMTVIVSTLIPLHEGDATWRQTNAAFTELVAQRAAAGDRVMLADMADGGPQAGDQIPDGVHPNGEGYALMAQVWHPAVVEAIGRYTTNTGGDTTQTSRCEWYAAAVALAGSIEGVTDPRAAEIRAELTRLGITTGSDPPPECRVEENPAPAVPDGGPEPVGSVGRIALSSDGNQHDEDDWASSAMGLAILAHRNLQPNVVHYDYNNHIWDSAVQHRQNMIASVMGAGERFGFDTSRFYDDTVPDQLTAGVENLTAEINRSGPGDELWLVLAGPMETAWMALDAADPQARQSVKCLSHGEWNETHGQTDHGGHSYDDLIDLGCQRVQIPDQNSNLGETSMSDWDYLRGGDADMEWLYSRIALHGDGDVSDAGMDYYVITGEESVSRSELRSFFEE
jgi:lysophospholipase L1-like esterase